MGILHSMKIKTTKRFDTKEVKNMKTKFLSSNSRNMLAMGIYDTDTTKIYLKGQAKDGSAQWYESKGVFTNSTALKYFYAGQYSVVFAQGITKSGNTDWI